MPGELERFAWGLSMEPLIKRESLLKEGQKEPLIQKLHEPLSPAGASAYTNLFTVVQAFALAALLYVATRAGTRSWEEILQFAVSLAIIAVIWHRYALDVTFLAWRLTWLDTAVPFVFAALQCLLVISIADHAHSYLFAFIICALCFFGVAAYGQALAKSKSVHARLLYGAHFEQAAGAIYDQIILYLEHSVSFMILSFIATLIAALLSFALSLTGRLGIDLALVVTSVVIIGVVVILFTDDVTSRLVRWFDPGGHASDSRYPMLRLVSQRPEILNYVRRFLSRWETQT